MATMARVSFALAAAAGKRKRKLSPVAVTLKEMPALDGSTIASEPQVRQLTGCFNLVDDEEPGTARDNDQHHVRVKQPRLQLEDARAKTKRLQDEGSTLAEAGRLRAAIARWTEAIDVDPTNAITFELLAQVSMALCEDFRAIQFALRATQLAPAWGDGFHTLARCHRNYGELELALRHIDKAIELNGASEELITERLEILALLAKQREVIARREAQEAQTRDEGALQALSCLKHLALRGQTASASAAPAQDHDK